jgi:hypothetical protein
MSNTQDLPLTLPIGCETMGCAETGTFPKENLTI